MKCLPNYFLAGMIAWCGSSAVPLPRESNFGTVEIKIQPEFFGEKIVLGAQRYHSTTGDSLYLDLLRFYLSQLQLQGPGATFEEKESYHLIDLEENSAPVIVLKNVPAGQYEHLYFLVGTDSLTNISGALGGDLDPTLGMYWAWNTGYINIKIEGRSPSCNTRNQAFEFHIGGYQAPHQTVRQVALPLGKIKVRENEVTSITLKADLGKFFSQLDLSGTNSVLIPSAKAAVLADYFQQVFSLK